jgi:hypothetical protein
VQILQPTTHAQRYAAMRQINGMSIVKPIAIFETKSPWVSMVLLRSKCESNALCWFETSMNWMELAPNPRQMPTILVVSVEAAEMKYDSIETSEIS